MKNEDIKKAFECLTPSEEAKDRMFEAILEKASAEPLKAPWIIRFRPVISTAGALAACGVLFTFAALNPHITGGKNDFVETKTAMESSIPAETAVSTAEFTSVTAKSTTACNKTTSAETKTTSVSAAESEVYTFSETTMATAAASVTETTAVQTEPVATTQSVTSESEAEFVTSVSTSAADLYGDLYDFSRVTWAGLEYTTDYEEVAYSSLVSNLGSGAAFSDTSDGAYTILIYEIEGVPIEKGFAVHYMGQSSYYYFYSAR